MWVRALLYNDRTSSGMGKFVKKKKKSKKKTIISRVSPWYHNNTLYYVPLYFVAAITYVMLPLLNTFSSAHAPARTFKTKRISRDSLRHTLVSCACRPLMVRWFMCARSFFHINCQPWALWPFSDRAADTRTALYDTLRGDAQSASNTPWNIVYKVFQKKRKKCVYMVFFLSKPKCVHSVCHIKSTIVKHINVLKYCNVHKTCTIFWNGKVPRLAFT